MLRGYSHAKYRAIIAAPTALSVARRGASWPELEPPTDARAICRGGVVPQSYNFLIDTLLAIGLGRTPRGGRDDAPHAARSAPAPRCAPWLRAHEGDPSADRRAGEHRERVPRAREARPRGARALDAESAGGRSAPRALRDHRRRERGVRGLALGDARPDPGPLPRRVQRAR